MDDCKEMSTMRVQEKDPGSVMKERIDNFWDTPEQEMKQKKGSEVSATC